MIPGMLIALDQLGLQIAPLVAGLGVAGLGVGLALQGVLSNIVAASRSSSRNPIGWANTSHSGRAWRCRKN